MSLWTVRSLVFPQPSMYLIAIAIIAIHGPVHALVQDVPAAVGPQAPDEVVEIVDFAGCGNCHRIPGVPNTFGGVGPDLTQIGRLAQTRRPGYTAKAYIREAIVDPDAFIPPPEPDGTTYSKGIMLGAFDSALSDKEVDRLVNYLARLGRERPRDNVPLEPLPPSENQPELTLDATRPPETRSDDAIDLEIPEHPDAQVALGKYLFFDRRLSGNNALSCASCHQPDYAFTDGRNLSRGYPSTSLFRNTPSVLNCQGFTDLYWDGRIASAELASLIRDHIIEAHFMNLDGRLMVERLKQVPAYRDLFERAFGAEPSFGRTLQALAAYTGSLRSRQSPYDRHRDGDEAALAAEAKAGLTLFQGKAGCIRCHYGPVLSDGQFHDFGLDTDPSALLDDDPERHVTFRRFFRSLGVPGSRGLREDVGRFAVSLDEADRGAFRTPGLRELPRTAPYMHDGRFDTLEQVVRFYNRGGGEGQRASLVPLGLDENEIGQLVAFLEALSGPALEVEVPDIPRYGVIPPGPPKRNTSTAEPPREQSPCDDSGNDGIDVPIDPDDFPPLGPLPPVPYPPDNPTTPEKVALGRLLYFDARMSGDGSISCNTCHPSVSGYAARSGISMGGTGTSHWRNATTVLHAGYYTRYNWDGAASSIEKQNAGAWTGAVAGNLDVALAEERLFQIPEYRRRFRDVFGGLYPTWEHAVKAVAAYQRSLISTDVPFDRFLNGSDDAISTSARRGLDLFRGKARCIACHHGPLLSDLSYHALGVPPNPEFLTSPLRQITFRYEQTIKGVPRPVYDEAIDDYGLYYLTKDDDDRGKFKTPTLRELVHTPPYMHNGVFSTLEDVVRFYNRGGGHSPQKDSVLRPLRLDESEITDLIAFLESLSGTLPKADVPDLPPYGSLPSMTDRESRR